MVAASTTVPDTNVVPYLHRAAIEIPQCVSYSGLWCIHRERSVSFGNEGCDQHETKSAVKSGGSA